MSFLELSASLLHRSELMMSPSSCRNAAAVPVPACDEKELSTHASEMWEIPVSVCDNIESWYFKSYTAPLSDVN